MSDWKRVYFKQNKAWVRVDDNGEPIVVAGRVEIAYKPDDARTYKASPANISPLDGDPPPKVAATTNKRAAKPATGGKTAREASAADLPKDAIVAYTDGACSGNPGEAGAGVVLISGARRLEISQYLGKATNNIAELTAIRETLTRIKSKSRPVRIHTDSAYAIGVLTKGWKAKKNPELVEEIRALLAQFKDVALIKVAGHAGIEENEAADRLAVAAVQARKSSESRG